MSDEARTDAAIPATRLARLGGDERGQAAIEFVLVVPFLVVLLLGAVEMFNMSQASRKLTLTTATMGDLVTQAGGVLRKSDMNGYYKAAKPIMGQFDTSRLALSVFAFTVDSRRKPRLSWQYHLGSFRCSEVPRLSVEQRSSMRDGNDLVITRGCYRYRLTLGRIVLDDTRVDLRDEVTFRPRNTLEVKCQDCS